MTSLVKQICDTSMTLNLYHPTGDEQSALEDLSTLLKVNKRHVGAYHSKAVILTNQGKFASAIYNLSQAIGVNPRESDLYLLRAELYEKVCTVLYI